MMMQWDQASLSPQQVILVGGSTASGKSGWTVNTIMASGSPHRHCIINADSMQIYDALDTLIAAPTAQEKALVSHHVYGVANAYEGAIGVAKWRTWVHDAINQALANNQRPWVVGGTGFYLRTLCDGLSPIPDMKASEVSHWREHYGSIPLHDLHQQLALVDEQSAQRLKDTQRIIHALIVKQLTGCPLSWWHQHPKSQSPYSFFKILHWYFFFEI
jgi:tRNA dimethylallyltransferase